jgi:hypothetical protein
MLRAQSDVFVAEEHVADMPPRRDDDLVAHLRRIDRRLHGGELRGNVELGSGEGERALQQSDRDCRWAVPESHALRLDHCG